MFVWTMVFSQIVTVKLQVLIRDDNSDSATTSFRMEPLLEGLLKFVLKFCQCCLENILVWQGL